MLDLSSITLLCVDTRSSDLAEWAIDRCLRQVRFAKTVLMTNLSRVSERKPGIEYVQAPPIASTHDYSRLMLTGIAPHVVGSHALVMQWDGFIIHPELWDPAFLDYDYIGAVWPHFPSTPVGNGGFSLRSKRLIECLLDERIMICHPEDTCICVSNRPILESEFGIRFATADVAERFAVERTAWHPAFGFHGFFNFAHVLEPAELERFIDEIPASCCGGVDTRDLVSQLRDRNAHALADRLFAKHQLIQGGQSKRVRAWWHMRW
jgi:hypothetical protein